MAGLIGLNVMSLKSTPKSDEELQAEAQEAAAAKQGSASPAAPADAGAPPGSGSLSDIGPAKLLGRVDASKEVIVGFNWTPAVQADPSKVYGVVQMLERVAPDVRIRVVDVDQVPAIPAGVSVGSQLMVAAQKDGSISIPPEVAGKMRMLMSAPAGATRPGDVPTVKSASSSMAASAKKP